MAATALGQDPNVIRASAGGVLGRLALVKRDIASPDRIGFYRGEIAVAERAENICIDLLFANGNIARRFEVTRAARGERIVFNWNGRSNDLPIDHQLLTVTMRGVRAATVFVWATIAAVRFDRPASDPIFCTAIGQFRSNDIMRISNEVGL